MQSRAYFSQYDEYADLPTSFHGHHTTIQALIDVSDFMPEDAAKGVSFTDSAPDKTPSGDDATQQVSTPLKHIPSYS